MDNGATSITYEETRADANTVKGCANEMDRIFKDFEATMQRVGGDDAFVGDANESLQGRFAKLKTRFDSYVRTVDEFHQLIMSASEAEETTERTLSQEAEALAASEKGN